MITTFLKPRQVNRVCKSNDLIYKIFIYSRDRVTEIEKEAIHLLVHYPNDHGSQGWARLESGTWGSIRGLHGCMGLKHWAISHCFPGVMIRAGLELLQLAQELVFMSDAGILGHCLTCWVQCWPNKICFRGIHCWAERKGPCTNHCLCHWLTIPEKSSL